MKKCCIIILILACISGYGQRKKTVKNHKIDSTNLFYGNSYIAVIHYDSIETYFQRKIFRRSAETYLTKADVAEIETQLNKSVKEYNEEQEKAYLKYIKEHKDYKVSKNDFIIDLKRYKRQYVAVLNYANEKEVYINCFCESYKGNWKKDLVIVKDGGNCYFQLVVYIKGRFYNFLNINGIG